MTDENGNSARGNFKKGEIEDIESVASSLQEPTESGIVIDPFSGTEFDTIPAEGAPRKEKKYDSLRTRLRDILNESLEEVTTPAEDQPEESINPEPILQMVESRGTLRGLHPGDESLIEQLRKQAESATGGELAPNRTLIGLPINSENENLKASFHEDLDHRSAKSAGRFRSTQRFTKTSQQEQGLAGEYRGSGFILLETSEIRDAVGTGVFRLRIRGEVFEEVAESTVVELIKRGVFMGGGEIAELDGPWVPILEHPIFLRLRGSMATKAHQLLRTLNIPTRVETASAERPPDQSSIPPKKLDPPALLPVDSSPPLSLENEPMSAPPVETRAVDHLIETSPVDESLETSPVDHTLEISAVDQPVETSQHREPSSFSLLPLLTLLLGLLLGLALGWFLSSLG